MGKGDKRRQSRISREEEALRWKLALNRITFVEFEKRYRQLIKEGKVYRK